MSTSHPNVKMTLLELIAFNSFRPSRHGHLLLEETLPVTPPDLEWVKRNYYARIERERAERERKRAEGKRKGKTPGSSSPSAS